jgi:outer membrane protein
MNKVVAVAAGLCMAGWVAFPATAVSADMKIGVIQMDRVVRAFPDAKSADSRLKAQVDEFETERDLLIGKINDQKKILEQAATEAQDKALSEAERERKTDGVKEKLKTLRDMEQQLRETSNKQQRGLAEMEMRLRKHIMGKLKDIVAQYAKKNEFTLILDSTSVGVGGVDVVLYSTEKVDVTEAVLKLIEEQAKNAPAVEKEVTAKPDIKKK